MTVNMSSRSLRKSLPDMCGTEVEEAQDNHQEKHAESIVQRGHRLRHSPRERRTSQPFHHGDGLRPVSEFTKQESGFGFGFTKLNHVN